MKKKIIVLASIFIILVIIAIIAIININKIEEEENNFYTFFITEKNWESSTKYTVDIREAKLKEKETSKLNINFKTNIEFTLDEVTENGVIIKTSKNLKEKGAITEENEFTIKKGTPLKLSTTSSEQGASFQIELK